MHISCASCRLVSPLHYENGWKLFQCVCFIIVCFIFFYSLFNMLSSSQCFLFYISTFFFFAFSFWFALLFIWLSIKFFFLSYFKPFPWIYLFTLKANSEALILFTLWFLCLCVIRTDSEWSVKNVNDVVDWKNAKSNWWLSMGCCWDV